MQRKADGFARADVLTAIASTAILAALLIPAAGFMQDDVRIAKSLSNLRVLGTMHVAYANDWNGRQWTVTPDNLTELTRGGYRNDYGGDKRIPPVTLGFDCDGVFRQTSRGWAIQQSWWTGNCTFGNFRFWHVKPFNNYANGKAFDPLFWAPRQLDLPHERHERMRRYMQLDCEWPTELGENSSLSDMIPTYAMSLAAQVDPRVYRGPRDGGARPAGAFPLGHKTPNLAAARYPDLKTHMIEHYWLNPMPDPPFMPYIEIPWFFNMSDRAEPATLFFDGSVRLLPNMEVLISNDIVVRQGEDSLWACDMGCFGCGGYFERDAQPPSNLKVMSLIDQVSSHHVFTRDGIWGRDTIFSE